jgi:predicted oxidoreductase
MGLEADEYCRLLDADNQPIPGLYGVGELIIGSVVGDGNYPSCGTCLAAGIYGGVVAVRHQLGIFQ